MSNSDRLRHLLLMLSSPFDNEIIAAAKAIGLCLKKEGADWHSLADRLIGKPASSRQHSEPRRHEWDELDSADIAEELLKVGESRLTDRERSFLEDMTFWSGKATFKQDHWLRSIAARLRWKP